MVCLVVMGCAIHASAQSIDPVSLVIAKVIKAIDLKVQKLQNETIWLQQAQQVVEHELSKTKLAEITDWQNKQQSLYADYFKELSVVKSAVKALPQVKQILSMQAQVVQEYGRFAKDASQQMQYDELLGLSRDVLQTLQDVLTGSTLQMKDADSVLSLCTLRDAMNECLEGMKSLNKQTLKLAANKTRLQADLQFLQRLNGKP